MTDIIAHRGGMVGELENTLIAFEQAIHIGADGIELDVRRCRDHLLVVHHDETWQGIPLAQLSLADIQSRSQIPTLLQVLELTAGRIHLDIELKESGYEIEAIQLILEHLDPQQFIITSFQDRILKAVAERFSYIKTGLLLDRAEPQILATQDAQTLLGCCRAVDADLVLPHWSLIDDRFLGAALDWGLPIWTWTVNEASILKTFFQQPNITGIITDLPAQALAFRTGL